MTQKFTNLRRAGISIIEVMTAILVAMIGVFGVMVLIPFSVSQAEHGLNVETATTMAANAADEFKIRNFVDTSRWAATDNLGNLTGIGGVPVRPFVIDPVGVRSRLDAPTPQFNGGGFFPFIDPTLETTVTGTGIFDTFVGGSSDRHILMDRLTITDQQAVPQAMSKAIADHFFTWSSDLVLNEATNADVNATNFQDTLELAPPQQVFDQDGTGTFVRRQALRDMSYLVVMTPNDVVPAPAGYDETNAIDQVFSWRSYFVVYKDKPDPVQYGVGAADEETYDRVFEVKSPLQQVTDNNGGTVPPNPNTFRIAASGGDLELSEIFSTSAAARPSSQPAEIKRGDWMMLTNVVFNPVRQRYFQQVNFYQVVDADFSAATSAWNVTLQGPNFDFFDPPPPAPSAAVAYASPYPSGDTGCSVTFSGGNATITPSKTYAVHLPDVWTVFERTFR